MQMEGGDGMSEEKSNKNISGAEAVLLVVLLLLFPPLGIIYFLWLLFGRSAAAVGCGCLLLLAIPAAVVLLAGYAGRS